MLTTLGALVNIGVVMYLAIQAKACLTSMQLSDLPVEQNPLVLSFIAILALFLVLKTK